MSRKRCRDSEFSPINEALYNWYLLATSRNIYPSGPHLCEKAKQIAQQLGLTEFKGSNGWLARWKTRNNIKQVRICGESGEVCGETVDSWKECLPELLQGFSSKDIYNLDETGFFWRGLPETGFGSKGSVCHGGKTSKQRLTIALIANADGEKESPVIIWKSKKPRCFKNVDVSTLPVQYYDQSKAWMTGEILDKVLTKLNRKFSSQSRSVALLLDNAGCHPHELDGKYSHIKLIFLPPNTTSKLQPLDAGIIQNFKVHYKTILLRYILSKIDDTSLTGAEIVKTVDVLKAIRWAAQAWDSVKQNTISKCFKKCGILSTTLSVVSRIGEEEDPFAVLEEDPVQSELSSLINDLPNDTCSEKEYVTGDDLPICDDASDDWDEHFMTELQLTMNEDQIELQDDDGDDESFDLQPPALKYNTYQEAMFAIEDVQAFLDSKGHNELATSLGSQMHSLVGLYFIEKKSSRQTTIEDYFV